MKTVLCADDNPIDLKYVVMVIHAMDPEVEVLTVNNGAEALAKWREVRDGGGHVDLALIDNHMGEFDGQETIEYLRKESYAGPAYILTGDKNIQNLRPDDICDVFYKPLNRHYIQEALKRMEELDPSTSSFVDTSDLDDLISILDAGVETSQDPLLNFRCKTACSYRSVGSQAVPNQGWIVDLNKKGLHLLLKDPLFKNTKLEIKASAPLNLDVDVLVKRHVRCAEGFVYDMAYLYIRRALV